MRKLYILLLISIFFVGCSTSFEPEMCSITVESSEYYTYELEKTEAPLGSLVKISGTPVEHYKITGVGNYVTYFEDPENENAFYFLVSKKNMKVYLKVSEIDKKGIRTEVEHCEVTFPDGDYRYVGDTVKFSIEVDRFYYLDEDSLSIKYENDKEETVDVEITETSENNFSFVMPTDASSSCVDLHCTPKLGFAIEGLKENYLQNDEISFELKNVFEDETVDIYLDNNFENGNKILLFSNVTSGSYTIDLSKIAIGKNSIYVCPYDNPYRTLITTNIQVDLLDTPEGWTTTGLKVTKCSNSFEIYFNNVDTFQNVMVNYYFENDKTKIYKKSDKTYSRRSIDIYKSDLECKTGKMVLWIEDAYNKIISPKITIDLDPKLES